jgi:hypothetical protein
MRNLENNYNNIKINTGVNILPLVRIKHPVKTFEQVGNNFRGNHTHKCVSG